MARHAIVMKSNMSATGDGSLIKSAKYYTTVSNVETEIDNGNLVELGTVISGEREILKATTPTSTTTIASLGLVCTPELIYDESVKHGLEDYYNEAGKILTIFRFHSGDVFGVTKEAFVDSTAPTAGASITFSGTKFTTAGEDDTVIGKVRCIDMYDSDTYYIIDVAL